jgi:hypothetical protein
MPAFFSTFVILVTSSALVCLVVDHALKRQYLLMEAWSILSEGDHSALAG